VQRQLDGRVVLLTGATEGVGRAAATEFAARGATVTIVGRDAAKTRQTAESIRDRTGNAAVDHLIADLSTLSGMRAVAAGFRARRDRLDILVNNAGAVFQHPVTTVDGLDRTFALNHLAYFVISTELSGLLRATPGARVVNTASSAHKLGRLDHLETVATRSPAPGLVAGFRAYCDAKLANVVFTRELARRLDIAANCHHPGYARSRFLGHTTGVWPYLLDNRLARIVARPPEHTARTLVWLATDAAAGAFRGEYFVNRKPAPVNRRALDPELGARLWALSESLAAV
jgi:retinol dehydrogenase 12